MLCHLQNISYHYYSNAFSGNYAAIQKISVSTRVTKSNDPVVSKHPESVIGRYLLKISNSSDA